MSNDTYFKQLPIPTSILLYFFFLCPLIPFYCYALPEQIKFQRLNVNDGLSQNSIYKLLQDKTGFIWIATRDGLNRFDGYEFRIYRNNKNDPTSLSDNLTNTIYIDKDDKLWIGTQTGGVSLYDHKTDRFSRYYFPIRALKIDVTQNISSILQDKNGIMWIGSQTFGLIRFNLALQTYQHYLHDPNDPSSLSSNKITTLFEDQDGQLWVGTKNAGLNIFHPQNNKFTRLQYKPDKPDGLISNSISTLCETQPGNLWIGTEQGLDVISTQSHKPILGLKTRFPVLLHNKRINHLRYDIDNNLWISTNEGLLVYQLKTGKFTHYQHQALETDSISSNAVYSTFEDKAGNIWIGTHDGGISKFNKNKLGFKHIRPSLSSANSLQGKSVYAILEDKKGLFWFATKDGGLNQYDPAKSYYQHFLHDPQNPNSLSGNEAYSLLEDSKDNLWIGTYNSGLNRLDRSNGNFHHYQHEPGNPHSLGHNMVTVIYEDHQKQLWMGTHYAGLHHYEADTDNFTNFRHDPSNPYSISSNQIWDIHEDTSNTLWIGTGSGGLNKYDRKKNHFIRYQHSPFDRNTLSNNSVNVIHENLRGLLWIGTMSGLNLFNPKTKKFKRYFDTEAIYAIEEDDYANLWLATGKGITKYHPNTETRKDYDVDDGLQSNEFNGDASFASKSGKLFFGGVNGITTFYPKEILDDKQIPDTAITQLLISNKAVQVTPPKKPFNHQDKSNKFFLQQAINTTKSLTFTHQELLFAFDFAALNFTNPKKNQYAYKLDGWDKNWIYTDYKMRRAVYTNIPHGKYVFKVKSSNSDGIWNDKSKQIAIHILPPPWKTWWAYCLYTAMILSCLWILWIIMLGKNKMMQKHLELLQEKQYSQQLHELDQLKDEFITNTSHELSTPLDKIIKLAQSLLLKPQDDNKEEPNKEDIANCIISNGWHLSHLIDNIIDLSKLKNNSLQLNKKPVDLYALAAKVIKLTQPLLFNSAIRLENAIPKNLPLVLGDENCLEQILYNLVNNSIKFTAAGKIAISAVATEDEILITVKDTGTGMAKAKLQSLNQLLEQSNTKQSPKYASSGMSLVICNQLVKLHGGNIQINTLQGIGSEFTVNLPHNPATVNDQEQ